jgi:hypothetical protein
MISEKSIFIYGTPVTVQIDLHHFVCTILSISKENYEGVVFARGDRKHEGGS